MADGDAKDPGTGQNGQALTTRRRGFPTAVGDGDYPVSTQGRVRCTAKNRAGSRCGRYSSAPGTDKCRFHGGNAYLAHMEANGRYAEHLGPNPELSDTYEQFLLAPDLCDLTGELALQRTMLASVLAQIAQQKDGLLRVSAASIAAITALNDQVSKLAERQARIEQRAVKAVSVNQLHWFVDQVVRIISEHVTDPQVLAQVASRMDEITLPTGTAGFADGDDSSG